MKFDYLSDWNLLNTFTCWLLINMQNILRSILKISQYANGFNHFSFVSGKKGYIQQFSHTNYYTLKKAENNSIPRRLKRRKNDKRKNRIPDSSRMHFACGNGRMQFHHAASVPFKINSHFASQKSYPKLSETHFCPVDVMHALLTC